MKRHSAIRRTSLMLLSGVLVWAVPSGASPTASLAGGNPRPRGAITLGGLIVGVDDQGSTPGSGSTGHAPAGLSRYTCRYHADVGGRPAAASVAKSAMVPGQIYWRRCIERSTGKVSSLRRLAAVAPTTMATTAEQQFQFPIPGVAHSPVDRAYVGIPAYFWLTTPHEFSAHPTVLNGVPIIAVGVPTGAVFVISGPDPFGSQLIRCDDPWMPYSPTTPTSDLCGVVFDDPGDYTITATIIWAAGYSDPSDPARDQQLGFTTTTTTFDLEVAELDTAIRRNE